MLKHTSGTTGSLTCRLNLGTCPLLARCSCCDADQRCNCSRTALPLMILSPRAHNYSTPQLTAETPHFKVLLPKAFGCTNQNMAFGTWDSTDRNVNFLAWLSPLLDPITFPFKRFRSATHGAGCLEAIHKSKPNILRRMNIPNSIDDYRIVVIEVK